MQSIASREQVLGACESAEMPRKPTSIQYTLSMAVIRQMSVARLALQGWMCRVLACVSKHLQTAKTIPWVCVEGYARCVAMVAGFRV